MSSENAYVISKLFFMISPELSHVPSTEHILYAGKGCMYVCDGMNKRERKELEVGKQKGC